MNLWVTLALRHQTILILVRHTALEVSRMRGNAQRDGHPFGGSKLWSYFRL